MPERFVHYAIRNNTQEPGTVGELSDIHHIDEAKEGEAHAAIGLPTSSLTLQPFSHRAGELDRKAIESMTTIHDHRPKSRTVTLNRQDAG